VGGWVEGKVGRLIRIVPWVKGFQSCSKNFIPCRNQSKPKPKGIIGKKLKNLLKTNKA
jgi:hypothetical protein